MKTYIDNSDYSMEELDEYYGALCDEFDHIGDLRFKTNDSTSDALLTRIQMAIYDATCDMDVARLQKLHEPTIEQQKQDAESKTD